MSTPTTVYRFLLSVLDRLVDPLRADEQITKFTLSIPEAQTTTVDSVQGLQNRPPSVLRCPGCEAEMHQHHAMGNIDCPECWREFPEEAYADLELLAMICPRCESEMNHGRRHPMLFDTPEWATCPDCQYHWDLDHWF